VQNGGVEHGREKLGQHDKSVSGAGGKGSHHEHEGLNVGKKILSSNLQEKAY